MEDASHVIMGTLRQKGRGSFGCRVQDLVRFGLGFWGLGLSIEGFRDLGYAECSRLSKFLEPPLPGPQMVTMVPYEHDGEPRSLALKRL